MLKFDEEYKRKEQLLIDYMDYQFMIDAVGSDKFDPEFCEEVNQKVIETYRDLR